MLEVGLGEEGAHLRPVATGESWQGLWLGLTTQNRSQTRDRGDARDRAESSDQGQFACIRFVFILCAKDLIGLSVDLENPIHPVDL